MSDPTFILTIFLLCFVIAVLSGTTFRLFLGLRRIRTRYAPINDIEAELRRASENLTRVRNEQQQIAASTLQQRTQMNQEYEQARIQYEALKKEITLLEENLDDISCGLYKPHFNYQTSEQYKIQLESLRDRQRQIIREEKAVVCFTQWTVSGSQHEGARMTKQYTKLLLRAFNGECDAALAKISWNNATKMEERICKSFEAINRLGSVMYMAITADYLSLKLNELWLTYEYEEMRYQEKEEQRQIREQMREEERVQRELEKAKEEAEREEVRFQKALEKARKEAERATGEEFQTLNERIRLLESQLEEAHRKKERAIAQAQITRSGHVYVISNIGSFGPDVYKIGMTRRLDPMERVYELGDASVPFPFDVHAMFYTENAPDLEKSLHEHFSSRRINLVNARKEFFQVSLNEIEEFARTRGLKIELTELAEAKEYRESVSRRQQSISQAAVPLSQARNLPVATCAD
ncbi:MAG: DUF4041 domain-containing protein [Blastocatellia bacterium]